MAQTDAISFAIRVITWSDYELRSPVVLQDQNGPCPLIALINTLILKTETQNRNNQLEGVSNSELVQEVLQFKEYLLGKQSITLEDVKSQLAHLLVKFNDTKTGFDLDRLLESLPLLHTGLSVNPDLTNGSFEHDLAVDLFQIFDLQLVHGWVIDKDTPSEIHRLKYFDSVQEHLITEEDTSIRQWLEQNSTQLTEYGRNLLNNIANDDFVVFFRNNHFNTLYKKGIDDFYVLLTDSSFNRSTSIVWQSLISTNGSDDLFFAGDFTPVLEETDEVPDESYDLIKQLQEQDDAEYARDLQKSYQNRKPPVKKPISPKLEDKQSKITSEPKKKVKNKKTNCVIV